MQIASNPQSASFHQEVNRLSEPNLVFADGVSAGLHCHAVMHMPAQFNRYMQGMLRRQPGNLKRHVQYILSLTDAPVKDHETIYAALLDLFIVLEDKGLPLRRRMLAVARPFLSHEDHVFFQSHLEAGITAATRVSHARRSLLTGGFTGDIGFISKRDDDSGKGFASLLEEALSLIEYGDLEEARGLLVQALKMEPGNAQVAEELVGLCSRLGDGDTLAELSVWFMANNINLPQCWPLL